MPRPPIAIAAAVLAAAVFFAGAPARADDAHPIPQSLRLAHEATIQYVTQLAARPARVGEEARRLLPLYQAHMAKEDEYILPPLTLLPALARGEASPDMRWAIPMSDRVKAEQDEIYRSHTAVIEQCAALEFAAENAGDNDVRDWVHSAIVDDLGDLELQEPMAVLVGDILRARLGVP
jgi:hypothetical protein